jgi:DNA-binding transcriptional MocR family regulator
VAVSDQIPFTRGVPSADLLPVADLRAAAAAAFEADAAAVLSYAPAGYPPLRSWIAGRHGTTPDRVVVVNGSLEGVDFLARHLFADGEGTAIVEEPTYDRTLKVLRAHGARIEPVSLDDDGPALERLAELLRATPRPRAVYLIPTYQNPSGLCTSLEKRQAIVALARERGVLVIEDDPYGLLRFEGEPLPTLHELDGGENVIHSSSFTKTIAPGVRTGYLLLPERLVDPLRLLSTNTTIAPNTLAGAVVAAYCEAGRFEPNVARVIEELRARRDAMEEALRDGFPTGARWTTPAGGYFFWVELPGIDTVAALPAAAERGVAYVPGADFCASGGGHSALRLAFSACGPDAIREGIARLGAVLEAERAPAGALSD